MNEQAIVSKMHEYLHIAAKELCAWLSKMLPRVGDDWWQVCVIDNLSFTQKKFAREKGYSNLEDLDLAALLRVADKSWYDMRSFAYLPTRDRQCVRDMVKVRNNWAHVSGSIADKDIVLRDLDTILAFFENVMVTNKYTQGINDFKSAVENTDFSAVFEEEPVTVKQPEPVAAAGDIQEKDRVYLTGDPDTKGMVFSVTDVDGIKRYEVFVDGEIKTFYDGQIQKIDTAPAYSWIDLSTLQSNLTAYEINNPSAGNLYSLNAARIDFVPYQFRPALKLIKSDEPKILIADSVGVGKTIEAGLIIKELEARNELDNILIICPKPLVAERKWELEMRRFDEDFIPLDGAILRQAISDTHRDEEWPVRYNKAIIPYSILDGRVYEGEEHRRGRQYGLLDLDPAPHFDLVIIDEAHHIRNGSLDKDKAYAYKCVRYFCEHADAVVMLTATPLQTSDDDLFTLMNLLRPDVIMDKDVFRMMSRPNEFIYRCSHAIRGAGEGWRETAIAELTNIKSTQWGENVIAKNPLYVDIIGRLEKPEISREERVKLVSDVESLHSFSTMLNRTRRKDIQDFCIRRSYTVETSFTPQQYDLHNELLKFEFDALAKLHNVRNIPFMMSTIRRQAASCIFGLAPHIRDLITRRFDQMVEDPDVDLDEYDLDAKATSTLMSLAQHVLNLADMLPEEDPKLESVLKIIDEKQKYEEYNDEVTRIIRDTLALRCSDGKMRSAFAVRIFLPITQDGINIEAYYRNLGQKVFFVDLDYYNLHDIGISKLVELGVRSSILVGERETEGEYYTYSRGKNPSWHTTGDFRWKLSADALRDVLKYISSHPTAKDTILKSQTIMKLLVNNEARLCGRVNIVSSVVSDLENEPCEMIRILRGERMLGWDGKWIFTESGELVAPKTISKHDISTSYYGRIKPDSIIFKLLAFKRTEADEVDDLKKMVPQDKLDAFFEMELRQRYGMQSFVGAWQRANSNIQLSAIFFDR